MGIFLPFAILCNFHVVLTFSTAINFFFFRLLALPSIALLRQAVVVVVVAGACHEILQSQLRRVGFETNECKIWMVLEYGKKTSE